MIWSTVSVVVYIFSLIFLKKTKLPFFNPLLLSILIIIPVLFYLDIPYEVYFSETSWTGYFMQAAVVALALPLYEQVPHLRANLKFIAIACLLCSFSAIFLTGLIASIMGVAPPLLASLLVKSVTTAVALDVSQSLDGETSIVIVLGLFAGLTGAIFSYPIFRLLKVTKSSHKGIIMGGLSHAIGTAACLEVSAKDAAFSSFSLILTAIFSSLLAPLAYFLFNH